MERTGEHQYQILVVEDDESIGELLSWILTDAGYRVTLADNLRDARLLLTYQAPDLIIADLLLPDGMGSDFVRHARERFPSGAPAAIIMSAVPQAEDHATEAGADLCLTKPFDLGELLDVVSDLVHMEFTERQAS